MYRAVLPSEEKKYFGLPVNYTVSGFLCHGTWKREEEIDNLKKALNDLEIGFEINELPRFLRRMVEIKINGKIFWFDVPYGGAMLSEYLQLASLFGSKKNILIGSCGGLSEKIKACDCVVPAWTFGNESTTRMYDRENGQNKHFPDRKLVESLKSRLPKEINVHEGPTVTCQAMLGETWEDVQNWSKEGYLGVEMEASTLFAVSNHFGVPSAALLVNGDNLIKEETTMHENFLKQTEKRLAVRQEFFKASMLELNSGL